MLMVSLLERKICKFAWYTGTITHIHAQDRNAKRCPPVVRGSYPGALAGRRRLPVFAKGALYPTELPGVRFWRRPQQLCAVWPTGESAFLNLCPRETGARSPRRHSERSGIAGVGQSSRSALRRRAQAYALADEVNAGRNGQSHLPG